MLRFRGSDRRTAPPIMPDDARMTIHTQVIKLCRQAVAVVPIENEKSGETLYQQTLYHFGQHAVENLAAEADRTGETDEHAVAAKVQRWRNQHRFTLGNRQRQF